MPLNHTISSANVIHRFKAKIILIYNTNINVVWVQVSSVDKFFNG